MMMAMLIIAMLLAIVMLGLLAASETSLFSLSSLQVQSLAHHADKKKRLVGSLLLKPRDLLVTILMVNIAMSILVQNIVASVFDDEGSFWVNVLVPLVLVIVLGEVIPKALALSFNEAIALKMAPFVSKVQALLSPLRKVLLMIVQPISRFFFFFLKNLNLANILFF